MKHTEVVVLTRHAQKGGGDRYENSTSRFIVYIPQRISRPEGIPLSKIRIIFEADEEDNTQKV